MGRVVVLEVVGPRWTERRQRSPQNYELASAWFEGGEVHVGSKSGAIESDLRTVFREHFIPGAYRSIYSDATNDEGASFKVFDTRLVPVTAKDYMETVIDQLDVWLSARLGDFAVDPFASRLREGWI